MFFILRNDEKLLSQPQTLTVINENLRYINLNLHTIDDLYLLLNGLIPNVEKLIVELHQSRLLNENEIVILNHQFPDVKYLELLFPLEKQKFLCCFKTLFSLDYNNLLQKRCFWSKLIHFRIIYTYKQLGFFFDDEEFHDWLVTNTDLKLLSIPFIATASNSIVSIWL